MSRLRGRNLDDGFTHGATTFQATERGMNIRKFVIEFDMRCQHAIPRELGDLRERLQR